MPLTELLGGAGGYVLAFVVGALLGSFANVCILRLPRGESIVRPPSHCMSCGVAVRWFDNLPIASWLILRGRCRACGARFSPRYLLVEIAGALLVTAVWSLCTTVLADQDGWPLVLARAAVYTLFVVTLLVIAFIDLDHKKIPDRITYPAIPAFFAFGLLLGDVPLLEQAIGVLAGYGVIRLLSDGYYLITKREGLGYGDGKLLAVVGALLGWRAVLFALFGGSVLGTVVVLPALLVARRRRRSASAAAEPAPAGVAEPPPAAEPESIRHLELPFGPLLAAGAVIYLFVQRTVEVGLAGW